MIGIIDYGMGNLRSVQKGLEWLGTSARILTDPSEIPGCTRLILPGVGAFRDAVHELHHQQFVQPLLDYVESGKPLLGICLGMQLLFDRSYEDGDYAGLGIIPGEVIRFQPEPGLKIPHMGWNSLEFAPHVLLKGVSAGDFVYFVHSYHVCPNDPDVIVATTCHGSQRFVSIVNHRNVFATQFHPEKSQQVGLQILKNFIDLPVSAPTVTS